MNFETNGVKGELNINASLDTKKNIAKNKSKHGDVIDNSTNQSANNIINGTVVHQNFQVTLSSEQLNSIVGIAQEQITESVKTELMKQPEEILRRAFKEISPMFLATFASEGESSIQVNALVNESMEAAIRKQIIQVVGFLTNKDLELLKLLKLMHTFVSHWLTIAWNGYYKLDEQSLRSVVEKGISDLSYAMVSFENKYGLITPSTFENLKRNGVINNDGNTHKPVDELICKAFYKQCNDKSLDFEYENEDRITRTRENRNKWTNWYSKDKFNGTFVETILHDAGVIFGKMKSNTIWNGGQDKHKFYWQITELGEGILSNQQLS